MFKTHVTACPDIYGKCLMLCEHSYFILNYFFLFANYTYSLNLHWFNLTLFLAVQMCSFYCANMEH